MANVLVQDLVRHYGLVKALKGVSFSVEDGEFLTLLGPSGCGKSTTLAALAGLDKPTSGKILVGEKAVYDSGMGIFIDAQFRNLGLMFQSYALWPHMTVYKNLDFTLELRKVRGVTAKKMIMDTLALVDMENHADRYPGELSGGQQQRVALARTLVYGPEILLLDEPLSNLDAKLRERARVWLGDLQRRTGVTTIYVTHDQSEALAMSDKVIVMDSGEIAQMGTPKEIYDNPRTEFVADFVGASNILDATLKRNGAHCALALGDGTNLDVTGCAQPLESGPARFSIRPEKIRVSKSASGGSNVVQAKVLARSYLGARYAVTVEVAGQTLRIETAEHDEGDMLHLELPAAAISVFPQDRRAMTK